jgi:hypothetical protein
MNKNKVKALCKIISISIPLLLVIGFVVIKGMPSLSLRNVIAIGIPWFFTMGFIDATYANFNGILFDISYDQVFDKLRVDPGVFRAIGIAAGVEAICWAVMLIGVFLGNEKLVSDVALFNLGVRLTDFLVTRPMWKILPKPDYLVLEPAITVILFVYWLSLGWLMAAV